MTDLKFPDVGEGITEGIIVGWKVNVGDTVKVDDILAEVETDKAIVEWPTSEAGTITELRAKEGDTINVGQVVVVLDGPAEAKAEAPTPEMKESESLPSETPSSSPPAQKKSDSSKSTKPAKATEAKSMSKVDKVTEKPKDATTEKFESTGVVGSLEEAVDVEKEVEQKQGEVKTHTKVLPAVRMLAQAMGVDVNKITGTGTDGMVTVADVAALSGGKGLAATPIQEGPMKKLKYDFFGHLEYIKFKGIRKTIAENMVQSSQLTAAVTHHDEADVTELIKVRNKEKVTYEKLGIKLTPLAFIVKALCLSLEKHPLLNATIFGEDIKIYKYYNVGIAVDTERGLLVPKIVKAQDKSIQDIAKEIVEIAEKARESKLDIAEMKNGTITITNYGSIGGRFATPIINYPESAILGLGRASDQVVAVDGKAKVRLMQPFSITFDHRIVDGAEVARFANTLKEYLEDPNKILVEEK